MQMRHHNHNRSGTKVFHLPTQSYADRGQKRKDVQLHIAGESLEWGWTQADRELVYRMWREGRPGMEICQTVGRHWLEVAVLVYEGMEQGVIQEREGGWIPCL